jgi:hypothetical protein
MTKAARFKRIQLEEAAYNYAVSDVVAIQQYDTERRSRYIATTWQISKKKHFNGETIRMIISSEGYVL